MFVDDEYFTAGYVAGIKQLGQSTCPLLFDAKPRKAWMLGYEFGSLFHEPEVADDKLTRVEKSSYQQGYDAFKKGLAREDCPYSGDQYGNQADQLNFVYKLEWVRGWRQAEQDCYRDKLADEPASDLPPPAEIIQHVLKIEFDTKPLQEIVDKMIERLKSVQGLPDKFPV